MFGVLGLEVGQPLGGDGSLVFGRLDPRQRAPQLHHRLAPRIPRQTSLERLQGVGNLLVLLGGRRLHP